MIPFNKASFDGNEVAYLLESMAGGHTSGNGPFSKRAESLLESLHGTGVALLTTSCTHALELSARLMNLQPNDEIIVPAYTFVSTASSFMWNGARPVFADIDPVTLNIDPAFAESLVNARTRGICIVHYGGVAAEPDRFASTTRRLGLQLIEDNAHGLGARFKGQRLGTFGSLSTLSFHETKNITCGEGGALIVQDRSLVERAEILRDKGTDRSRFLRGQVDKYSWVDVGSSWVMSDLLAAILLGQLERFEAIQRRRLYRWNKYQMGLSDWARDEGVRVPVVPPGCEHTGHVFHLRFQDEKQRNRFIAHMGDNDILTVFHYQALNASRVGAELGYRSGQCPHAEEASRVLVRLPLFGSLGEGEQDRVIETIREFRQ